MAIEWQVGAEERGQLLAVRALPLGESLPSNQLQASLYALLTKICILA